MKIVFALLWFASAAVAQLPPSRCDCASSPGEGFWFGADCTTCDPSLTTGQPVLDGCRGAARCSALSGRPEHERTCHGLGTCNEIADNPLPCTCFSANNVGTYCESCEVGFVGWPLCQTEACSPNQGGVSLTCNNRGSCDDSNMAQACGTRFGQPQSYTPQSHTCVELTTADGLLYKQVDALLGAGTVCGKGTERILCQWDQKCEDRDEERPVCCDEGTKLCRFKKMSGECCSPWQTCCDGVCCNSDAQCSRVTGTYSIPAFDIEGEPEPFGGITISGPRWRTPDGKRYKNLPRICLGQIGGVEYKMTGPATIRVVFMPIMLVLTTLISAGLMFKTTGFSTPSVALPALLIVICACITYFSWLWAYGVLMALSAFVALGATHKGGSTSAFGLIFQFIALAILCGGMGMGVWMVAEHATTDYNQMFPSFSGPNARPSAGGWAVATYCKNYYGYFTLTDDNRPPNINPLSDSAGYCATGFISFVWFAGSLAVSCAVLMLAGSGSAYLDGAPKV